MHDLLPERMRFKGPVKLVCQKGLSAASTEEWWCTARFKHQCPETKRGESTRVCALFDSWGFKAFQKAAPKPSEGSVSNNRSDDLPAEANDAPESESLFINQLASNLSALNFHPPNALASSTGEVSPAAEAVSARQVKDENRALRKRKRTEDQDYKMVLRGMNIASQSEEPPRKKLVDGSLDEEWYSVEEPPRAFAESESEMHYGRISGPVMKESDGEVVFLGAMPLRQRRPPKGSQAEREVVALVTETFHRQGNEAKKLSAVLPEWEKLPYGTLILGEVMKDGAQVSI
ncbi:MAG: hypothetical protein Q9162_002592 [Coniocarpon cinnabarinum]